MSQAGSLFVLGNYPEKKFDAKKILQTQYIAVYCVCKILYASDVSLAIGSYCSLI